MEEPLPSDATKLPDSVIVAYTDFSGPEITPAVYQQQQITRLTQQAESGQSQQSSPSKSVLLTTEPASQLAAQQVASQPAAQNAKPMVDPITGETYGPYVPYKPTSVQLGSTPEVRPMTKPEVTDVLPTARYVPNAKVDNKSTSRPDLNGEKAAAIRRRQSEPPPPTGQSKPPVEDYNTTPTEGAQYTGQTGQIAQPGAGTANKSCCTSADDRR